MKELHILFDAFPSPDGAKFIEIEDEAGMSLSIGEWRERDDGLVELVIKSTDVAMVAAVKPLEWSEGAADGPFAGAIWRALGFGGHYEIERVRNDHYAMWPPLATSAPRFRSPEAAKEAAQADHDTRVRALLEGGR